MPIASPHKETETFMQQLRLAGETAHDPGGEKSFGRTASQ